MPAVAVRGIWTLLDVQVLLHAFMCQAGRYDLHITCRNQARATGLGMKCAKGIGPATWTCTCPCKERHRQPPWCHQPSSNPNHVPESLMLCHAGRTPGSRSGGCRQCRRSRAPSPTGARCRRRGAACEMTRCRRRLASQVLLIEGLPPPFFFFLLSRSVAAASCAVRWQCAVLLPLWPASEVSARLTSGSPTPDG